MTAFIPTIQQLKTDTTLPNYPNIPLSNYPLMIKEVKAQTARNNKPYLAFTFGDSTGLVHANLWDTEASEIVNYPAGRVALINGFTVDYQGRIDIQIKNISLLDLSHEYSNPALYVKSAPYQRDVLEPVITNFLEDLSKRNPLLFSVVYRVFEPRQDAFFQQASSKQYRHAVAGGVAQHTVYMLQLATTIAPLYPNIDYDILKSAILLHDLGKVESLTNPVTSEDTTVGLLVTAPNIADGYLVEATTLQNVALDDETIVMLRHTILSSANHSTIAPATREALVLRHLSALDSDLFAMDESLEDVKNLAFSQPIFAFENRKMYKGFI